MKGTLSVRYSENIVERVARVSTCESELRDRVLTHIGLVHQQQAACCREDGERSPMGYAEFRCNGYIGRILDGEAAPFG
jgi:hypothetical protein